jgi:hypothetical protein
MLMSSARAGCLPGFVDVQQSEGTFFFSGSGLVQQGQYTQAAGWQSTDALRVGTAAAVQ